MYQSIYQSASVLAPGWALEGQAPAALQEYQSRNSAIAALYHCFCFCSCSCSLSLNLTSPVTAAPRPRRSVEGISEGARYMPIDLIGHKNGGVSATAPRN